MLKRIMVVCGANGQPYDWSSNIRRLPPHLGSSVCGDQTLQNSINATLRLRGALVDGRVQGNRPVWVKILEDCGNNDDVVY